MDIFWDKYHKTENGHSYKVYRNRPLLFYVVFMPFFILFFGLVVNGILNLGLLDSIEPYIAPLVIIFGTALCIVQYIEAYELYLALNWNRRTVIKKGSNFYSIKYPLEYWIQKK